LLREYAPIVTVSALFVIGFPPQDSSPSPEFTDNAILSFVDCTAPLTVRHPFSIVDPTSLFVWDSASSRRLNLMILWSFFVS